MATLETSAICIIKIDNKELKSTISGIQLDQFIDRHHEMLLRVQQIGKATSDRDFDDPSTYTALLGKSISVNIRPEGGIVDEARELEFIGIVTEIQLDNSIDGLNNVIIAAQSPTISMDGAAKNAHYFDMTASDIIGSLVRNYAITVGTIDSSSVKFKFDTQYRETDFDYIMRLANGAGMFAYYNGKDFNLTKAKSSTSHDLKWRETLGAFKLGLGTAPIEFNSKVYNYEQKKIYQQDSKSLPEQSALSSISKTAPDASKKIYKDSGFSSAPKIVEDAQTLDKSLQNEKARAMGSMIRCTGQSIVPKISTGSCVKIIGMDKLDGQYWLQAVRHIFDESGKYHNIFVCTPLDIAYPSKIASYKTLPDTEKSITDAIQSTKDEVSKKFVGVHVATVVDNNDPEKLGRIQVTYPWMDSQNTNWVRMAVPYAGSDRGWISIPEIDDEVLIGYEHGDTDHPIALGALYNNENKPPSDTGGEQNNVKIFLSRGGNKIQITDEDGKEKIEISMKDGENQIVMDISGPTITIESKGDIAIKGANLSVEAKEEIKFEAQSDINIKGANITLEATANMKLKAGAQQSVEGALVAVKGNPIQLN
ncbi:MAG: phage baseplate assembly protein V [Candidatus Zixiibacteriota bacterium]